MFCLIAFALQGHAKAFLIKGEDYNSACLQLIHQRASKNFSEWETKVQALPETQHLANPHGKAPYRSHLKVSYMFWGMILNIHMAILL